LEGRGGTLGHLLGTSSFVKKQVFTGSAVAHQYITLAELIGRSNSTRHGQRAVRAPPGSPSTAGRRTLKLSTSLLRTMELITPSLHPTLSKPAQSRSTVEFMTSDTTPGPCRLLHRLGAQSIV